MGVNIIVMSFQRMNVNALSSLALLERKEEKWAFSLLMTYLERLKNVTEYGKI